MNRRFLALALAGVLSLSLLSACGGSQEPAPETDTPAVESPTGTPETEPTPTPEETGLPETTPPAEESPSEEPSDTPSTAPSAKPSEPPASSAPSTQPTPTPAPVEPEPTVDVVQSTWNAISQLDIPSLSDVDAETLSALYGISTDDLVSYVCKMPAISVQATEFFIAEVKDGKMDAVKAAVEKRQADLVQQWSQYLPEQLELVENYQLVTSGNYILFAISEHADQAVSAFNSYTN